MKDFVPPTPAEVRAIRDEADRLLTPEEIRELDAIPLGESSEREVGDDHEAR